MRHSGIFVRTDGGMLRLLSLTAILAAPASALVYTGRLAFANKLAPSPDSSLYAVFSAFPPEVAYLAPVIAIALVALGYFILRLIGFAIALVGGAAIVAMIVAVFFKPEWIETARQMLASG